MKNDLEECLSQLEFSARLDVLQVNDCLACEESKCCTVSYGTDWPPK